MCMELMFSFPVRFAALVRSLSLLFDALVSIWSGVQQTMQPRMRERRNARNREAWMNRSQGQQRENADDMWTWQRADRPTLILLLGLCLVCFVSSSVLLRLSFCAGASIVQLATSAGMSPCTLARVLLEDGLHISTPKEIREALRDPRAFFRRRAQEQIQMQQAQALAHTSATADAALSPDSADADGESPPPLTLPAPAAAVAAGRGAAIGVSPDRWISELSACVQHDEHHSPYLDSVRNLTGSAYESLLESHLARHGIPFVTEAAQRVTGLAHKTPDVRLLSPILVHGQLVNWIDSKAQFADAKIKQQHLDTQLRSYVNRFGKGMVIYWLDFVEGEPDACSTPLQLPGHGATTNAGDTVTAATAGTGALPPSVCSFAAPATYDNGDILLLTDFPSDLVTMDQLLQAELHTGGERNNGAHAQPAPTSTTSG